ncbi:hypothetical protein OSB04_006623 [Centaurea solstitialis]|uniref:ATP phosphoribosyltransferase n=1 Tax=Centaurea solstitialis TaxID=347529 RepID=A0AA38TI93_9ASTR|nr:hypothetical protein OSB04_006623 [Centaurea solstitialis]
MSKYSSAMRFDVEKFDGRINFGLWQVQVKDVLIQSGLHKALKGKPVSSGESSSTSKGEEEWEDLDLRAASTICLCLAKNVLANVHGISTAKELWEKFEQLYQGKGISNRLYLKEQFHTLRMDGGTKISDHLSVLNNVVSELEAIGVKVEDEDKALRLILSLPSSYEHMKPILMYGKETLKFADVTSKLLSEEKRLEGGSMTSSEGTVLVARHGKKKNSGKVTCWKCGESGHVKSNCPGGVGSAKGSKSDADNISILMGDDELRYGRKHPHGMPALPWKMDVFMLAVPRFYTYALVWQGCRVWWRLCRWLMNFQMGIADAIVDLVSSGTTLKEKNLKEIEGGVLLQSQLLNQQPNVFLHMLLQGPTISLVFRKDDGEVTPDYYAIVTKKKLYKSVQQLRAIGGSGVLVSPLTYIFYEETPRWR